MSNERTLKLWLKPMQDKPLQVRLSYERGLRQVMARRTAENPRWVMPPPPGMPAPETPTSITLPPTPPLQRVSVASFWTRR